MFSTPRRRGSWPRWVSLPAILFAVLGVSLVLLALVLALLPTATRTGLRAGALSLPYALGALDWSAELAAPLPATEAGRIVTSQGGRVTQVETGDEERYRVAIEPPFTAADAPEALSERYARRDAEIGASLDEISRVMATAAAEATPDAASRQAASEDERTELRAASTELAALARGGAASAGPGGAGGAGGNASVDEPRLSALRFRGSRAAAEAVSRDARVARVCFAGGCLRDGARVPAQGE